MGPDPKTVASLARDYTEAWNSKSADKVASFYAEDGEIVINRGEPWRGRARVAEMAAGFYADVPDLSLSCDEIRCAGSHAAARRKAPPYDSWNTLRTPMYRPSTNAPDSDRSVRTTSGPWSGSHRPPTWMLPVFSLPATGTGVIPCT